MDFNPFALPAYRFIMVAITFGTVLNRMAAILHRCRSIKILFATVANRLKLIANAFAKAAGRSATTLHRLRLTATLTAEYLNGFAGDLNGLRMVPILPVESRWRPTSIQGYRMITANGSSVLDGRVKGKTKELAVDVRGLAAGGSYTLQLEK